MYQACGYVFTNTKFICHCGRPRRFASVFLYFIPFILPASVEQPVFGKKVGKEQKLKRYMDGKMPGSGRLGRRLYFS